MITTKDITLKGNLGTNLFKIATVISSAIDNSDDFILPEWKYSNVFKNLFTRTQIQVWVSTYLV